MEGFYQTTTPNLQESIDFYQRLGFKQDEKHPQILHEAGQLIYINETRTARPGLRLYSDSWSNVVEELSDIGLVHKIEDGYCLADPSNSWIYLLESEPPELEINEKSSKSILGNFAGLSLESGDIQKSLQIYQILGFKQTSGTLEQGWLGLENEKKMGVGLLAPNNCPHLFFNPSFNYFNGGKNDEIIPKIKAAKVKITEEITVFNTDNIVDNIIIRDPGGFGFFIFND